VPARVGDANRSSSGIASFDTVFEAGKASPVQQSAVPRPAPAAPDARGANAPLARAGTAPPAPEAVPHQGFIPYKWRHHGSAGAPGACGSGGGGLSPGASSGCSAARPMMNGPCCRRASACMAPLPRASRAASRV